MIDDLRRINRIRALVIGLIVGLVWFVVNRVFDIPGKLAKCAILPLYFESVTALIFLPMFLGAVLTAIYMLGIQQARWHEAGIPLRRTLLFEGIVIAAIATVAWWVVPLVVLGLMQVWLIMSFFVGAFLDQRIGMLTGEFSFVGSYIGTAIGGGILGGALGAHAAGVLGELAGSRPWNNKKLLVVGRIVGGVLGAVYGIVWNANSWFFF